MAKLSKKPTSIIGIICVVVIGLWQAFDNSGPSSSSSVASSAPSVDSSQYISVQSARQQKLDDVQALGTGEVVSLLPDDLKGSRHQRILVREDDGNTLLVVHNIDLAPRIDDVQVGDTLSYFGEYIWNEKGGLIHWTHHDPNGRHIGGWIDHNGRRYE